MRMWMIDPKLLCGKHLGGEHFELHKHRHNFEKGYKIEGRRGQIAPLVMRERHDELAEEMGRRGMTHKSPFLPPSLNNYDRAYLEGFTVDQKVSIEDLKKRCPECAKRLDIF